MEKRPDSYESLSKGKPKVYEDSEVHLDEVPLENAYEKAKWNSDGFDQSGMKK